MKNRALEIAPESGYTPAELEAYDRYWDAVRVEKTIARDAREEGFIKGIERGIEQGIEKTAIRMIEKKRPLEEICEMTGLSLATVRKLVGRSPCL